MRKRADIMNTIELWTALHEHPELSGQESTTIGILQDYLRQESDLLAMEELALEMA